MNNFTPTQEQIDAACDWWADRIVEARHDNGDPSGFAGFLADVATMSAPEPTHYQLATFKAALASNILVAPGNGFGIHIGSDYHPDEVIANAMTVAGIDHIRCPWKSGMWIKSDGTVEAKCGYRAQPVQLCPNGVL